MDETFFGENFINKVFGIFVIGLILNFLGWNWPYIGFKEENIADNNVFDVQIDKLVEEAKTCLEKETDAKYNYKIEIES